MAIDKIAGFNIGASEPVDNRIVLTKDEMKLRGTGTDNAYPMPDVYFALCKDDGKMYIYNKDNTYTDDLGYFRSLDSEVELEAEYHKDIKELELFGFNTKINVPDTNP